jgi:hypothetical protein
MKWLKSVGTFISPLFTEKDSKDGTRKLSLGRVAFWITFGIAVYVWVQLGTVDILASHMQMLYLTTTYNLMKKASWFGSVKTGDTQMTVEHQAEKDPYDNEPAPRI